MCLRAPARDVHQLALSCICSPALAWRWVPDFQPGGHLASPRARSLPGRPQPKLPAETEATHQGHRGDVAAGPRMCLAGKMSRVGPRLPGLQAILLWRYLTQDDGRSFVSVLEGFLWRVWGWGWGGRAGGLILGRTGFCCSFDPLVALIVGLSAPAQDSCH